MSLRGVAAVGAALALLAACASSTEKANPPLYDVGPLDVAPSDTKPDINGTVCIGPTPPASAWGAKPGPIVVLPDAGGDGATLDTSVADASSDAPGDGATPTAPTAIGADMPLYALNDFQPQSCGFKATYGLEPFKGKVTVVALLASW